MSTSSKTQSWRRSAERTIEEDVISSTGITSGTSDDAGAAKAVVTVPAKSSIHSPDPDSGKSEDVISSTGITSGTSDDAGAAKALVVTVPARSSIHSPDPDPGKSEEDVILHAVRFIRNTVKFGLVLFLKFSENYTRSVAYLLTFCFLILC